MSDDTAELLVFLTEQIIEVYVPAEHQLKGEVADAKRLMLNYHRNATSGVLLDARSRFACAVKP